MTVTTNILQRTFRVKYKKIEGTCFTIDFDNRRYLITARHIAGSIQGEEIVYIFRNRNWLELPVRLVGHGKKDKKKDKDIDLTVLTPRVLFGASHPLRLTTEGLMLAEDVYFLGFPYGLGMDVETDLNSDFPLPLVKKAVVSAIIGSGHGLILLDGYNNRGFSGGPVVRRWSGVEQTVIGVVAAYRHETQRVYDENNKETSYTYRTNTGIALAYEIEHALEIIKKNPIGIPVPPAKP